MLRQLGRRKTSCLDRGSISVTRANTAIHLSVVDGKTPSGTRTTYSAVRWWAISGGGLQVKNTRTNSVAFTTNFVTAPHIICRVTRILADCYPTLNVSKPLYAS